VGRDYGFIDTLTAMPIVAILRGISPEEAVAVAEAVVTAGVSIVEVPLNSPRPIESIGILSEHLGARALVGAGTVLDPAQVAEVKAAGGRLIVMPHGDPRVIAAAKEAGLAVAPGVLTPTEAFAALAAGADALKVFPGEMAPPKVIKALSAVLPKGTALVPTGGVTPDSLANYWNAGASGFGIGSALYRPGKPLDEIARDAAAFVAAVSGLPVRSLS
jgi:2-dehydro-3-deoxyphosphogalactonate aldolase